MSREEIEEIKKSYRLAKSPKKQIGILADLYDTDKKTIMDIVGEKLTEKVEKLSADSVTHTPVPEKPKTVIPDSVLKLVIDRMIELTEAIDRYESELLQLDKFLKCGE